jgi:dTDP-glucose pyrophosphorylase
VDDGSRRLKACSVHLSKTLRDAMSALDEGMVKIALVVDGSDHLVGILTDGNIRRALLGGATLATPLEPYVQRNFIWVNPSMGRAEVLELMQARTIEHLPIIDQENRLVGLHLLHELLGAAPRPNWAVVLAGGLGQRLRPLTENVPKPMLKVAGRPILERIVLHLVGYGIRRIFLSVNYLAKVIQEHFGDGEKFGCRIEYLQEDRPLGTGGCLSLLPETPRVPLLVLNGDLVTQFDVAKLLDHHRKVGAAMTVGTREHIYTVPFGVVQAEEGTIRSLHEKPTHSWQTNAGIYVIAPALCGRVPKDTTFHMPALVTDCLDRNEKVTAYPIEEDWIDVGRTRELNKARGDHE